MLKNMIDIADFVQGWVAQNVLPHCRVSFCKDDLDALAEGVGKSVVSGWATRR